MMIEWRPGGEQERSTNLKRRVWLAWSDGERAADIARRENLSHTRIGQIIFEVERRLMKATALRLNHPMKDPLPYGITVTFDHHGMVTRRTKWTRDPAYHWLLAAMEDRNE
jgi:hypothetical protein